MSTDIYLFILSGDSAFLIEEISEFEVLRDIWNLPAQTYEQVHRAQNILTEAEEEMVNISPILFPLQLMQSEFNFCLENE